MPFTVTIASGLTNIVLPNGGTYKTGDVVVLSDDQYSKISSSVSALIFSSVAGSGGAGGAISSVNGKTGVVVLNAADVSAYSASAGSALEGRQIIAGTGLTGGGTLVADRTLTVAYGTSGTTACVGNDSRLSDTRTPSALSVVNAMVATGAAIALSKLATDPLARANHTGTQTASTISDFATTVAATATLKANNLSDVSSPATARSNLGIGTTALLTADLTAVTSSTLVDATGLVLAVPGAGNFEYDFWIPYTGGNTANGITLSLNGPSASLVKFSIDFQNSVTARSMYPKTAFGSGQAGPVVANAVTVYFARIFGTIVATASGNIQVQHANTDNVNSTQIKSGARGRLFPL